MQVKIRPQLWLKLKPVKNSYCFFILFEDYKMSGLFITLEGVEGAGKSSLIAKIKEFLEAKEHKVECVREPGGTAIAEQIRQILKTPRNDEDLCDRCELLLMYAARSQLVNTKIKPLLSQNIDVICDRHDLSSIAYQGGGRGMDLELINKARQVAIGDFKPDLTLLLDLNPKVGLERVRQRGALDRFELSEYAFFERVRQAYLDYAHTHPHEVKVINAEAPFSLVVSRALEEISCLL